MRTVAITTCLAAILASSCHQTTDNHPCRNSVKMTRHDEIRQIMRSYWIHNYETAGLNVLWPGAERQRVVRELRKMKKDYWYVSDPNVPLYVPGPGWAIRGPLTIAQIEQESLQQIRLAPDAPQVPFGYENDRWNQLKSQYKDGDEFYFFSLYPRPPSFYGTSGYVLIRGNQVIGLR